MGKEHEDTCVPCECSSKAASKEEDFNNQVNDMLCAYQSAFIPSQFCHHPMGLCEKNGHGCRDGGNAQDYQHEFPFPKGDLVTPIAEYPIYQQQRPTLCPHRHHLGQDHPAA